LKGNLMFGKKKEKFIKENKKDFFYENAKLIQWYKTLNLKFSVVMEELLRDVGDWKSREPLVDKFSKEWYKVLVSAFVIEFNFL
jgi:hypothetical protein